MNCLEMAAMFRETPCEKKHRAEIEQYGEAFAELMQKTRQCLQNIGNDPDRVQCETALLSEQNKFTFHTHPDGTRYPSDIDKRTTKKLNKDYLCIGLVPNGETVCWHKKDNFKNEVFSF